MPRTKRKFRLAPSRSQIDVRERERRDVIDSRNSHDACPTRRRSLASFYLEKAGRRVAPRCDGGTLNLLGLVTTTIACALYVNANRIEYVSSCHEGAGRSGISGGC